ncbi:hypothetical protein V6N13_025195 [Hibiscus sabdariffa]|uniref:Isopenicillin N synthase-like Fe(2+) 2OG dioxygenase domain-containing protein n=2 Tax=Hibiscus sabdariffa TaxID=183260 RepID=A0ABR2AKT3_9ROSI
MAPQQPQPHELPHVCREIIIDYTKKDQIGGLQVLHQNHWIDVHPIPGALVVNLGDMLQLISNGCPRDG